MKTLVIQSFRTEKVPAWITACLESVRQWAMQQQFDYRLTADEIFALVPDWYRDKVLGQGKPKLPVITDYARLVLARQALQSEGYDQVIWMDADVLVLDQDWYPRLASNQAFGFENWVQADTDRPGKFKSRSNVHNATCVFRQNSPVLPFLLFSMESIIERIDPARIAPQIVGPKLLTALHNICQFELMPEAGAVSPDVAAAVIAGKGAALDLFRQKNTCQPAVLNLCASLALGNSSMVQLLHKLEAGILHNND